VTDYGLVTDLIIGVVKTNEEFRRYAAPEILNDGVFSTAADIYRLAKLTTGYFFSIGKAVTEVINQQDIPLLKKMMSLLPSDRQTANELLDNKSQLYDCMHFLQLPNFLSDASNSFGYC